MNKLDNKLILGSHLSISNGLLGSIDQAIKLDCNSFQIFTANARSWSLKKIDEIDAKVFKEKIKNSKIKTVICHANYLINIASFDEEILEKSILSLKSEIERCDSLEIEYIVLHPGSSKNRNREESLLQIANQLNKIHKDLDFKVIILLETMAGQGNVLASSTQELKIIYDAIEQKNRIGFCIDTCHIFACGYDIKIEEEYDKYFNDFYKLIGLNKIKVFHLNDSKQDFNSKVDRHEHIGQGKIGIDFFKKIMNDSRFYNVTKIIETPKEFDEDDLKNIKLLKSLIE